MYGIEFSKGDNKWPSEEAKKVMRTMLLADDDDGPMTDLTPHTWIPSVVLFAESQFNMF